MVGSIGCSQQESQRPEAPGKKNEKNNIGK
jgi:hypothetical protein